MDDETAGAAWRGPRRLYWQRVAGYALGILVEVATVAALAGAAYLLMWLIEVAAG